jgi:citrate lyase subunit beta/citryl-CoA lyase
MTNAPPPRPVRPRRSVLYVPAGNAKALAKSRTLDADALVFDLEDSTAPEAKVAARETLRGFFGSARPAGRELVIRINGLDTPFGAEDLLAARACKPDAILLPKISEPSDVQTVAEALDEMDAPESLRLWAMIETPRGVANAGAIADAGLASGSRLDCFVAGTNDLVKDTGLPALPGRPYLTSWLMQIVLAARTGGLDVLDGVDNDFTDAQGFAQECAAGRGMGFDGKTLIHPSQIGPANAAFGIDPIALSEAQAIVETFARPENAGRGVLRIGGRMVERLHLESAERLIEKAAILKRRQVQE